MGRYDTLSPPPGKKGKALAGGCKPRRTLRIFMSLSDDQVRRIARLARIAVRPEETAEVAGRLNRVLGLIEQMGAVDTSGIEPMAHPLDAQLPEGQRLRPDEVTETDRREAYQSVAPRAKDGARAVQDGLYLVPKVLE